MSWACAFDLDGVLVDTYEAVKRSYKRVGITMPRDAWGKPWRSWLPGMCGDAVDALAVHDAKNKVYPEMLRTYGQALPLSDVAQCLLNAGQTMVILTGASETAAYAALDMLGMHRPNIHCEMTVDDKAAALLDMVEVGYESGVYFDDQDNVIIPRGWQRVRVGHAGTR
jgi:beta-phosphoglucomutase-like phosphatase (HAD superfamily)